MSSNPTTQTKTESERREFLSALNLNPDSPALERAPRPAIQQPTVVPLAPEGVDPHTMNVTDIVFDPALVEHFPDLSPRARSDASRYVFALYRSYGRNKDRNSLLNSKIGEFLARTHRARETGGGGGFVKEKIRLANALVENDITEQELADFIAWKRKQKEEGK